jgi:hypothetical protein
MIFLLLLLTTCLQKDSIFKFGWLLLNYLRKNEGIKPQINRISSALLTLYCFFSVDLISMNLFQIYQVKKKYRSSSLLDEELTDLVLILYILVINANFISLH